MWALFTLVFPYIKLLGMLSCSILQYRIIDWHLYITFQTQIQKKYKKYLGSFEILLIELINNTSFYLNIKLIIAS